MTLKTKIRVFLGCQLPVMGPGLIWRLQYRLRKVLKARSTGHQPCQEPILLTAETSLRQIVESRHFLRNILKGPRLNKHKAGDAIRLDLVQPSKWVDFPLSIRKPRPNWPPLAELLKPLLPLDLLLKTISFRF